jgi:oligosaccharyltransferase complex subunit gamma
MARELSSLCSSPLLPSCSTSLPPLVLTLSPTLNLSASTLPLGTTLRTLPLYHPLANQISSVIAAEPVHTWLARHVAGPTPPLSRPVNYIKIVTTTVAILGTITAFTVAAPYVLPILQSRNLWAALSLIAVLLFTSGHMFNHIRKVPYVAGDGKGGISYFAGGFQNQFGLETQIVAAMCKFALNPLFPCKC